jgi:hypothetical protein
MNSFNKGRYIRNKNYSADLVLTDDYLVLEEESFMDPELSHYTFYLP